MTTSVLFGLEDEFVVSSVERLDHRPVVRVKGLDASGQAVELWWRKRRLRRLEPPCPLASGLRSIPLLPFDYVLGQ